MHQYLSKPCEPGQLFDVIRRAPILQETIKSASVLDAIGRANCLPIFPNVVDDIKREVESEAGTTRSIAALISQEPLLSALVLRLANSAIFSPSSPVVDLDRAIMMVGMDMTQALAISHAVYSDDHNHDRILSAQSLLDHGWRVAMIGKSLASISGLSADESNAVFTAGLLHDVGKLILLNAFPDQYKELLEQVKSTNQRADELEMEAFEVTHQGIGGHLFTLWGLPADLIKSVASHHSFEACASGTSQVSQLVFAANWIDRNRTADELRATVEKVGETSEAIAFAEQISKWQDQFAMSKTEN